MKYHFLSAACCCVLAFLAAESLAEEKAVAFPNPDAARAAFQDVKSSASVSNAAMAYMTRLVTAKDTPADAARQAYNNLFAVHMLVRSYDKAAQMGHAYLEIEQDPAASLLMALQVSTAYRNLNDPQRAAKVIESCLSRNRESLSAASVASAVLNLASVYRDLMNRSQDTVNLLEKEAKLLTNAAPEQVQMLTQAADLYAGKLKAPAKAEAIYQQLLGMSGNMLPAAVVDVNLRLAQLYRDTGRNDEAAKAVLAVMKNNTTYPSPQVTQMLTDMGAPDADLDEACFLHRVAVAEAIRINGTGDTYQPDMVRLLVRRGKLEEALQEARVYYYTCAESGLLPAVNLVGTSFKTLDGNLIRANRFLKFVKFGPNGEDGRPGSQDELADVLKEVPAIRDERRNQMYRNMLAKVSSDYLGYRRQGQIHLYLDAPGAAFQAYKKSFEMCPLTEAELQAAADILTGFVVRATRDIRLAETLVDYVMLGTAGKDGKDGTPDDLKDPSDEIVAKLRYAAKPAPAAVSAAAPATAPGAVPAAQPARGD